MAVSAAKMARAALLIAAVMFMHCCNAVVAARLLDGDGAGLWLRLRQGAGPLIMQVLSKESSAPPGGSNQCKHDPDQPVSTGGHCASPPP
jgi:hypothetical protein